MTTRRLRWLLMAGHVAPDLRGGGVVRYTVELARALGRRRDVELFLQTSREAAKALSALVESPQHVVPVGRVPGLLVPLHERYVLGRKLGSGFDVVQGVKHLVPRGVAAQSVLTVHDMLLFDRPGDYPLAKRLLLRQPYAASIRHADTLVCVSAATLNRLRQKDAVSAARAIVVPSATGSPLLDSEPRPVDDLNGRPFGLVVGDPMPRKNLAVVVSAWEKVIRTRPDAALVLVGPPAWGRSSYGPHFEALVASGHVIQLVGVDDGTLRWCYENAAVVLAPSLAEGFGLPALEALDLGAPLVTSVDPALVEVTGDRAPHLPFHDVAAWAAAALERLTVREAGRTPRADRRTWDDVAAETVAAVLGGAAAPSG